MPKKFIIIASDKEETIETFFRLTMEDERFKGDKCRFFNTEDMTDEEFTSRVVNHVKEVRNSD